MNEGSYPERLNAAGSTVHNRLEGEFCFCLLHLVNRTIFNFLMILKTLVADGNSESFFFYVGWGEDIKF